MEPVIPTEIENQKKDDPTIGSHLPFTTPAVVSVASVVSVSNSSSNHTAD
jgi:hypothetical protein